LPSTTKRSAKVVCRQGVVWIPPKQFWALVRDQIVEFISEPPLIGKFKGNPDDFLLSINHTVLDLTCPEHRSSFFLAKRHMRKRLYVRTNNN
jgi:hypothetical protein